MYVHVRQFLERFEDIDCHIIPLVRYKISLDLTNLIPNRREISTYI